jgi:signal transduction histidine kinase
MRAGHWAAIDCVVGGFAALCDAAVFGRSLPAGQFKVALVLLCTAGVFLPLALRRRAPVSAFGMLLILGLLVSGLATPVSALIFLAAAFVLYTVTVEGRRRTGIAALGLVLAEMVFLAVAERARPDGAAGVFVPVALASIIAWMTGYSVRQRRRYVVTLQQQAASRAVAEERLRIARELHDVVAHSMSVIAVQAGYGQYVIDTSPDGAREALGAIQATSRDALDEMRRMLGVLRQQDTAQPDPAQPDPAQPDPAQPDPAQLDVEPRDGAPSAGASAASARSGGGSPQGAAGHLEGALGQREAAHGWLAHGTAATGLAAAAAAPGRPPLAPAPLAPAPGLAGLDRLVERTRGAGVPVLVEVSGAARPVPAGVDLSAYRIIQEALTNVVKHAGPGSGCVVSLGYTDTELVLQVTDAGGPHSRPEPAGNAAAGTGHGITGMRERVNLCGGTFRAALQPAGGFQVTASLPLPPAATSESAAALNPGPAPGVVPVPGQVPSPALETSGPASGTGARAGAAPRDRARTAEGSQR